MNKQWKILLYGLVGLVLYVVGLFLLIKNAKTPFQQSQQPAKKPKQSNSFDELENLIFDIISSKYSDEFSEMVIAQAKHETGNFTSAIFLENKNLFGMKKPVKRLNLVIGENRGHGTFNSYEDSVKDYLLYLDEFNFKENEDANTIEKYIDWLKGNGYFTDTIENYLKGVKSWM